jgi:hypothetical protein
VGSRATALAAARRGASAPEPLERQPTFDAAELANYRLTPAVFKRFAHATRLMAAAMLREPRFKNEPLITREISVSGEAVEMATTLQRRLDSEPVLAAALFAGDISAHEYSAFAIALFAARLAQGFLESGAMRRVPAGVAADNVAFVTANELEVSALLKKLDLE